MVAPETGPLARVSNSSLYGEFAIACLVQPLMSFLRFAKGMMLILPRCRLFTLPRPAESGPAATGLCGPWTLEYPPRPLEEPAYRNLPSALTLKAEGYQAVGMKPITLDSSC